MPLQLTDEVCAVLLAGLILFQCRAVYSCNQGDIRLWNGTANTREGRVEYCYSTNIWWGVVDSSIGTTEAQVICRDLGYCTRGGVVTSNQTEQYGWRWTFNCSGNENRLQHCGSASSYGSYYTAARVSCVAQAPKKPLNARLTVINANSVRISWLAPDMSYCRDINNYIISCQDTNAFVSWTQLSSSTTATITNSYLFSYFDYECCVRGSNSAGEGPVSCQLRPHPTPPRNAQVSSIHNSSTLLMVEWLAPEHINGLFESYQVICTSLGRGQRTQTTTNTQLRVTGLNPFTQYQCCVSVSNEVHNSSPVCGSAITPQGQPTSPRNAQVSSIYNSPTLLMMKWLAPEHINGLFESYRVICTSLGRGQRTQTTTNTQLRVTGLSPFTQYQCCVSVSNEVHNSSPVCGSATTPQASPSGPPFNLTTEVLSSTMVTLSWEQPLQDELNGILRWYSITICQLQPVGTCRGYNTIQEHTTVPLLHPHYIYNWSVSAYTVGPGPYAHTTHFRMLEDRPTGRPQNITHQVIAFSSIQLSWIQPPLPDQNGVIIAYSVTILNADKTTHSIIPVKNNTFTTLGLEEITSYWFRVSAMTAVGEGPYLEYGPITTGIGWKFIAGMSALGVLILLISAAIFALAVCICVTHLKKQRKFEASTNTCSAGSEEAQGYSGRNTLERFYRGRHRTSKHEFEIDLEQKQSSPVGEENKLKGDNNEQPQAKVKDEANTTKHELTEHKDGAKRSRNKVRVTEIGSDKIEPGRHGIGAVQRIKKWFKLNKPQKSVDLPPIPLRQYLEDDQFMRKNFEGQPAIPSRSNVAKTEPTITRKPLLDEEFLRGLDNFAAKLTSRADEVDLGDDDKIYQPLIPPRRYEESNEVDSDVYQPLTLIRSTENSMETDNVLQNINDTESMYQSLVKPDQQSIYQPLMAAGTSGSADITGGVAGSAAANNSEGLYQPLTKRDKASEYQPVVLQGCSIGSEEPSRTQSSSEGLYQSLGRQQEENNYQSLTREW